MVHIFSFRIKENERTKRGESEKEADSISQLAVITISDDFVSQIIEDDAHVHEQNRIEQRDRQTVQVKYVHVMR